MSTGSKAPTLGQAGPHSTSARPESPLSLALIEFMVPLHFQSPRNFSQGGLKKGSKFRGCLLPESSLFHGYTSLKGEQIARVATTRETWWYHGCVAWESSSMLDS